MNTRNTIILFLLLFSASLFAQGLSRNTEFSPKSPEVASMPRFDNQSINEYTGKANINIPLVSLPFDFTSINLSLNYDSGGVRTDQEASWVGLGWNMTGVPIVTRTINGSSDIGSKKTQPTTQGYAQNQANIPGYPSPSFIQYLEDSPLRAAGMFVDTQPDIFTANLLNGSVKFQLSRGGPLDDFTGILLDESRAVIEFDNQLKNFTITDDSGYIYLFEDKEYASNFSYANLQVPLSSGYWNFEGHSGDFSWILGQDINTITSWYITKITSPNGIEVKFNYSGEKYDPMREFLNNYTPHLILSTSNEYTMSQLAICDEGGADLNPVPNVSKQWSRSILEVKYLQEIINLSTGERIGFKLGDRDDIVAYDKTKHLYAQNTEIPNIPIGADNRAKQINAIEHYSNTGDIIKHIDFHTSYFNQDDANEVYKDNYLRLKLDKVSIDNQNYNFQYDSPNDLPIKTTTGSDFWGFYNGRDNDIRNPSMVWDQTMSAWANCNGSLPSSFAYSGGHKGSLFSYGKIGSLTRITYPTSGYTTFDYEPNTITIASNSSNAEYRQYTSMYLETNNNEIGYPKNAISQGSETYAVGGLRVQSINNYDKNNQLVTKTDFSYEVANGQNLESSGVLMNDLLFYYTLEDWIQNDYIQSHLNISSSNKVYPVNSALGSHIGYSRVETARFDLVNGQNNGKVIHEFINKPNIRQQSTSQNLNATDAAPVIFEEGNGQLLKEYVYDGDTTPKLVKETINTYQNVSSHAGWAWKPYYSVLNLTLSNYGTAVQFAKVFDYFRYDTKRTYSLLTESVVRDHFDNNGVMERITSYSYTNKHQLQERVLTSAQDPNFESKELLYYPNSIEFGVDQLSRMSALVDRNRIGSPVYQRRYRNGRFVDHSLYTFSNFGSKILPNTLKYSNTDGSFNQMDTEIIYLSYNPYGRLKEYTIEDGITSRYVWGNEYSNVLARIVNYDSNSVEPEMIVDQMVMDNPSSNETLIREEIDKIRDHQDYSNSFITDYNYISGIGVNKIRNEREENMFYEYDPNERLQKVRDYQGNLLQEYSYNNTNNENICLDCLPTLDVSSNVGYEAYVNQNIIFSLSIPSGQSSISKWIVYYGDDYIDKGSGAPPSSFNYTFHSTGLKPIRIFTYHSNGQVLSGNINVRVYNGAIPGGDVFFDNIVTQSESQKTATLTGDVGSVVSYSIVHGGDNTGNHTGFVSIGGQAFNTTTGQSFSGQITLTNGTANCVINNYGGGSNSGVSSVNVTLTTTSIGQTASPSSINITRSYF
ncbi:hypothetical protein [uncultured Dokdonia sp.]|uniref:hypothetical protein n=1 Tax=uncultured Dokdonia sp. TaxID=575653 RepID=UPI002609E0C9|nr:hypothetical protein [uncultured Dokdonia sp.]